MVRVGKKDSWRKGENLIIIKRTNEYLGGRKPGEAGVDFKMYNKYLRVPLRELGGWHGLDI